MARMSRLLWAVAVVGMLAAGAAAAEKAADKAPKEKS